MANFKYGWQPDAYDPRDFAFKISAPVELQDVDLRKTCKTPEIFDQENIGSCTGNSASFMLTSNVLNKHVQYDNPIHLPFSRLFLYYGGRQAIGTVSQDSGAQIRDVLKAIANLGACSEKTWPYKPWRYSIKPSGEAYEEAIRFRALEYKRLNNTRQELVACLLEGFPFVFGFQVYESFESEDTTTSGEAQMPSPHERLMGGHAVCCVGYSKSDDRFIVANSWGTGWGQNGYFTMPADYMCDAKLASDFWVTKLLS